MCTFFFVALLTQSWALFFSVDYVIFHFCFCHHHQLRSSHVVYTISMSICMYKCGTHFTPFVRYTSLFSVSLASPLLMELNEQCKQRVLPFLNAAKQQQQQQNKADFDWKCDIITRLSDTFIIFILLRILCYVRIYYSFLFSLSRHFSIL